MGRAANRAVHATAVSLLALTASLIAHTADAGSFALREQSTKGQGQAFAGVAAGSGGLSSLYWNPATITQQPGINLEANASILIPRSEVTPQAGTSPLLLGLAGDQASGDIGLDAALPSTYTSYQFNERLWLGMGVNTPFGLSTKYDPPFSGQVYALTSRAISFNANPVVGAKVNDWLSVGAGAQVLYFETDLNSALSPAPGSPDARLEGDDVGFGFTLGATATPLPGTTIGVGFRSAVDLGLEGSLTLNGPTSLLPPGTYGIDADVTLPELLSIGITQEITPDIRVSGTFEWTNWSRLGTIPVVGNEGPTAGAELTELVFEYDDGYYLSVGGEYDFNDKLTLRAGAAYEWSPIGVDTRDLRLPDTDRIHLNAGATYKVTEKLSVDFAYLRIFTAGNTDVELTPGNPSFIEANPLAGTPALPFVGDVETDIDIVSMAVSYRF